MLIKQDMLNISVICLVIRRTDIEFFSAGPSSKWIDFSKWVIKRALCPWLTLILNFSLGDRGQATGARARPEWLSLTDGTKWEYTKQSHKWAYKRGATREAQSACNSKRLPVVHDDDGWCDYTSFEHDLLDQRRLIVHSRVLTVDASTSWRIVDPLVDRVAPYSSLVIPCENSGLDWQIKILLGSFENACRKDINKLL